MVFGKISLSPLMLLLFVLPVFAADVGIDFTIANAPPTVTLTIAPTSPTAGVVTFDSNATYHDVEMQPGTVNLTWYVGGTMAQPGGFYPAVASGATVTALPFTHDSRGGETMMICADVSDGINPPVSSCTSAHIPSTAQPSQPSGSLGITTLGGKCAYSPITISFSRTGTPAQGAFTLLVRHPDGTVESISVDANRNSFTYTPQSSGSYYFSAAVPNSDVTGTEVSVGRIIPVLHLPVCSFQENAVDHTISPTNQPVSVYVIDNNGVSQRGDINVTWNDGGQTQSASQSGSSLSFVPSARVQHHVTISVDECMGSIDFTPNTCLGNQTQNQTVQYQVENKTFYLWVIPTYLTPAKTCSQVSCNMTADCCAGYCFNKACVIPAAAPEQPLVSIKAGCYGLGECTDPVLCWFVCNFVWVMVLAVSAAAAYVRRMARGEAVMLFMLPLFVAVVLVPFAGVVAAFIALGAALYLKNRDQVRKSA